MGGAIKALLSLVFGVFVLFCCEVTILSLLVSFGGSFLNTEK
jgi:hypothetical protein